MRMCVALLAQHQGEMRRQERQRQMFRQNVLGLWREWAYVSPVHAVDDQTPAGQDGQDLAVRENGSYFNLDMIEQANASKLVPESRGVGVEICAVIRC